MKKLIVSVATILFCLPTLAFAADTQLLIAGPDQVVQGSEFVVRLQITTNTTINTVAVNINYSPELLQVTSMKQGGSILKLWPEEPTHNETAGTIAFIGGLPTPGFTGSNGQLLDIGFRATHAGKATITFNSNSKILLNDGQGTYTTWSSVPLTVSITKPTTSPPPGPGLAEDKPSTPVDTPREDQDTTPPIDLELIIGKDSHLFNGEWFAVFLAQDSESGISHYEIAEIETSEAYPKDNDWIKTISPYRLTRQDENTKIFLKAVDKAGNIAVISQDHTPKITILPLLITLLFVIILVLLLMYMHWRSWKDSNSTVQTQKNLL